LTYVFSEEPVPNVNVIAAWVHDLGGNTALVLAIDYWTGRYDRSLVYDWLLMYPL
jgi:hypothetical protein